MTEENLNEEKINCCEGKKCCGKCKHEDVQQNTQESGEAEALQKKADEYLNNWKRERADFVNYKKDEMERTLSLLKHSTEKFVLKLLPVLDNIYLAQAHLKDDGLAQIVKQFEEFLKKEGIEVIETLDKPFDPYFMEVIAEDQVEGKDPGIVTAELQRGYKMADKVIRPSKVKISK